MEIIEHVRDIGAFCEMGRAAWVCIYVLCDIVDVSVDNHPAIFNCSMFVYFLYCDVADPRTLLCVFCPFFFHCLSSRENIHFCEKILHFYRNRIFRFMGKETKYRNNIYVI